MHRPTSVLALFASLSLVCSAANVYINSPLVTSASVINSAAEAKYRMSHTNFDMTLANQNGGSGVANRLQTGLGNASFLNNRVYNFTLEHVTGTTNVNRGFIFTMSDGTTTTKQSWGSFSTTPTGQTASSLNSLVPNSFFNSLQLQIQADRKTGSGSQMKVTDLTFSGSGLTIADGSFNDTTVTSTSSTAAPTVVQRLVASNTTDLSAFNWSLSGKVSGFRDASAGGDEAVKFVIYAQNVNASIVPEPSFYLSLAVGLGGLVVAIRRCRSQQA